MREFVEQFEREIDIVSSCGRLSADENDHGFGEKGSKTKSDVHTGVSRDNNSPLPSQDS